MPNILTPFLKRLPTNFRNRYYIAIAIFFGWLLFFDKHDFLTQWKLSRGISKLKEDKVFYEAKINSIKQDKKDIDADKEKFAREHYFMSKANEDVFIIEEEK